MEGAITLFTEIDGLRSSSVFNLGRSLHRALSAAKKIIKKNLQLKFKSSSLPVSTSSSMEGEGRRKGQERKAKRQAKKQQEEEEEKGKAQEAAVVAAAAAVVKDVEDFTEEEAQRIRGSLLQWYDENHRVLPWRTASSSDHQKNNEEARAYAVWVSEVMLQQTRVHTVVAYYNRWMAKWPTLHHLAAASQEEVNEMWAGLGYYRRARFLLEGAKSIVRGGEFPRTAAALRGVKGIGEYTAGAIASIAFNEVVPVVDGNVVRVLSRLKAISANPKEAATVKSFWKLAGQLVDPSRPGDFNQAIMELGATLCSTTNPACSTCPISDKCRAFSLSRNSETVRVTDYPTKVARAKQRHDFAAVCVVQIAEGSDQEVLKDSNKKHAFLLVKRPEEGLLAGLWEFPSVVLDEERMDMGTRRKAMDKYLKKLFNVDVGRNCNVILREHIGEYVHVFSHIRLQMHIELLILTMKGGLKLLGDDEDHSTISWKCVDGSSIDSMGLTSGVRKVYNMIQNFKLKQMSAHPIRAPRKKAKRSSS
ncbi:adenine DNA glycosylase [Phoenix dactylifera]|uniref:Adenine DNA glycosylase n=1 Tax=Phoenix dactylifera TaxID=42345 RepID=A0A8B7CKU4_PHODC|nr:adenine DNA glycosylase [Phoenix dactylifera]